MANHSTINNLRMLNPHKFATYQFMKQYFSVSPKMFMNFTNPVDPTDYSYNDIIHMLDPFLNEFKHRDKSTVIANENEVNLPNAISQYNNTIARNSFNIIDHFGYLHPQAATCPSRNTVDYHGSIFAAFIPIFTVDRTRLHKSIGMSIGNTSSSGITDESISRQAYGYNFYNTGGYSGYMTDTGADFMITLVGGGTRNVGIDSATPFAKTSSSSTYGIKYLTTMRYGDGYCFNRVGAGIPSTGNNNYGKTFMLTKTDSSVVSIFKVIDNMLGTNSRSAISEIEKSIINSSKLD